MIKTVKIKEKLKTVWDTSEKPVSLKMIFEVIDYAINHENMESGAYQKNVRKILEKEELGENE